MILYPAIDLRDGNCVRLLRGDYAQETIYGDSPVEQALAFVESGADWIHMVDLDAALTGKPTNRSAIQAVCAEVGVPVQVGGGIRSYEAAEALFNMGVARVVIGTAALENPELVRSVAGDYPVAVGLDARGGEVATHGWTEGSGRTVADLAAEYADAGVVALVVTEISRDGTLEGPDTDGLTRLLQETEIPIIASGGVGSVDDLAELAAIESQGRRFAGVIVGKAIYEGALTVEAALATIHGATKSET